MGIYQGSKLMSGGGGGPSPYEIANQNGYNGTEQKFNQLLAALDQNATKEELSNKANLVNGKINEAITGYWTDIYIEKENVIIEYDGSGHFLNDKMNGNAFPTKDSLLREKEREDSIVNKGYKVIRFIATKDRIPSDEVILNLTEGFKNSDFKVIRIDFEEGTIDRDYEEKWYCNVGELRKITQKDLEQFEK